MIDTLKPECVGELRGKLNFSISYDKDTSTLHINLLEAVELPVKDITGIPLRLKTIYVSLAGSSDPYVRVFILQDPTKSLRTRVHRRNLNPKFNQTLAFPGRSRGFVGFGSIKKIKKEWIGWGI